MITFARQTFNSKSKHRIFRHRRRAPSSRRRFTGALCRMMVGCRASRVAKLQTLSFAVVRDRASELERQTQTHSSIDRRDVDVNLRCERNQSARVGQCAFQAGGSARVESRMTIAAGKSLPPVRGRSPGRVAASTIKLTARSAKSASG